MPVAFDHDRIELLDPGVQCPGGVRRSSCPVRKNETSRSIGDDPASILLCPTVELGENCAVAGAGQAIVGRHYDEFSFRGHLEEQIGMLRTECGELFIGHGMSCQDGGEIIFDQQHTLIVAPFDVRSTHPGRSQPRASYNKIIPRSATRRMILQLSRRTMAASTDTAAAVWSAISLRVRFPSHNETKSATWGCNARSE